MPSPWRSTQRQLLALALVLVACTKQEPVPKGDILATLTAPTVAGEAFQPDTLRGKPSIVMFVSPTCPHCIEEIPAAQKVAKEVGANVVAVFIAGKAENAKGVIDHTKFEGHALIDDGALRKRYGIRAVPYTLVVAPDGTAKVAMRGAQGVGALKDALSAAR
ncbi:MAG: TlpA disulfide reductase family protein [Kofleriaceae bacterium]|nr:TlpA disulfide reductase family protein [Kofleriaceae bacterium]